MIFRRENKKLKVLKYDVQYLCDKVMAMADLIEDLEVSVRLLDKLFAIEMGVIITTDPNVVEQLCSSGYEVINQKKSPLSTYTILRIKEL